MLEKKIKKVIRTVPNFPKKGIMFRDITPLLSNKKIFSLVIDHISVIAKKKKINKIIGIDSRGFIFAAPVAYKNKIPLVLIRKSGKLPGNTFKARYSLEYGNDQMELNKMSINKYDSVMIVDDLIATGGTAKASADLIKKTNSKPIEFIFIIGLSDLLGIQKLTKKGHKCTLLSSFKESEK